MFITSHSIKMLVEVDDNVAVHRASSGAKNVKFVLRVVLEESSRDQR